MDLRDKYLEQLQSKILTYEETMEKLEGIVMLGYRLFDELKDRIGELKDDID